MGLSIYRYIYIYIYQIDADFDQFRDLRMLATPCLSLPYSFCADATTPIRPYHRRRFVVAGALKEQPTEGPASCGETET